MKTNFASPDPDPVALKLEITVRRSGRVDVTGPISVKIVAYGLIELARDVIREYKPANGIVPVTVNPQFRQ